MKKIAIIGGEFQDCILQIYLNKIQTMKITVFEKNNSLNLEEGYGIQLSVNSVELLNKIGFKNIDFNEKFHPNKIRFLFFKK